MKKIIAVLAVVLMFTAVLAACGKNENDTATADSATKDSATAATDSANSSVAASEGAVPETTAVVETTAKGETVEKDKEGNVIVINTAGEIVSITDNDGKDVDIPEYLETHYIVTSNGKTYGQPDASGKSGSGSSSQSGGSGKSSASSQEGGSSSKSSGGQGSSSKSGGSSSSGGSSASSSSAEIVEEEIPTVIVEIPDDMDEYELPIL